jgi:hypothetical protein
VERPSPRGVSVPPQAWRGRDAAALNRPASLACPVLHRSAGCCAVRLRTGRRFPTPARCEEAHTRLIDLSRFEWQDRVRFFRNHRQVHAPNIGGSSRIAIPSAAGVDAKQVFPHECLRRRCCLKQGSQSSSMRQARNQLSIRGERESQTCVSLSVLRRMRR